MPCIRTPVMSGRMTSVSISGKQGKGKRTLLKPSYQRFVAYLTGDLVVILKITINHYQKFLATLIY